MPNVQMPDGQIIAFPDGMSPDQIHQEGQKYVAQKALQQPKAQGLLTPGNIDLKNRPVVSNPDGTSSTVRTITIGEGNKTVLIPTVVNGKIVSNQEAIDNYRKTGQHMGIFDSEDNAENYDKNLHNQMGWNGPPGSSQEAWQRSAANSAQNQTILKDLKSNYGNSAILGRLKQGVDNIIPNVQPFSAPAAVGAGTTAATAAFEAMPGGPIPKSIASGVAGTAAATAAYLGLHKALGLAQEGVTGQPQDTSTAKAAEDLGINEIGGRVIGAVGRGVKGVLKPAQEELAKLSPTLSSYFDKFGAIPKAIEDLFAPGSKRAAQENSAALGQQELEKIIPGTTANPNTLAKKVQVSLENNRADLRNFGVNHLQDARVAASVNPADVVDGATGEIQTIRGPIRPNQAIQAAYDELQQLGDSAVNPTSADLVMQEKARELIDATHAKFDGMGNLNKSQPMSFEDALKFKGGDRGLDTLIRDNAPSSEAAEPASDYAQSLSSRLSDFGRTFNKGMETSILKWKGGSQALQSYRNFQSADEWSNKLFNDPTTKLSNLIDSTTSVHPQLQAILQDSNKIQKVLNTGTVKIGGYTVTSADPKEDLAGLAMRKIFADSQELSLKDPNNFTINTKSLQGHWDEPEWQDARNQLFNSQTRSNIGQLFTNLEKTQQKLIDSWVPKIAAIHTGLQIGASLLSGSIGKGALDTALFELGATGVAHIMTSQKAARILIAAAAGQPLNMSEQMASRQLAAALQGFTVTAVGRDGERTQGTLDRNGEFQPAQPAPPAQTTK